MDGNNAILVADKGNHRVQKIVGEGKRVTTLAGSSTPGTEDGEGINARFCSPWALALDERGRLLVGDSETLRVIEASLAPPRHLLFTTPPALCRVEDYSTTRRN